MRCIQEQFQRSKQRAEHHREARRETTCIESEAEHEVLQIYLVILLAEMVQGGKELLLHRLRNSRVGELLTYARVELETGGFPLHLLPVGVVCV